MNSVNLWTKAEHLDYLTKAEQFPIELGRSRAARNCSNNGEACSRFRNGETDACWHLRLNAHVQSIALDFSPTMLGQTRTRFAGDATVTLSITWMNAWLGSFDAVVSSFAIHHLLDERKRTLYTKFSICWNWEGFSAIWNMSFIDSALHQRFRRALGIEPGLNKLLDVETQLGWLKDIGFTDVDCCGNG